MLLVFSSFFSPCAFSQQPAYFFLGEKEFEGVQIYDVIQDNALNYWFATDQGFYKYNNYTFEQVECADMKGLSAFGFAKSRTGIIFCHNLNNQIIKIENGKCSIFYELTEQESSNDIHLFVAPQDKLMVLTKIILVFDLSGKREAIPPPPKHYHGLPFQLPGGEIIAHLLNTDSLLVFDGNKFKTRSFNKALEIKGVLTFFQLNHSIYAIGTNKQIFAFEEKDFALIPGKKFDQLNEKEFLRFYNENGSLWMAGSVSGVRKLESGPEISLSAPFYPDHLISDVFTDSEGNLLFSTFNHGVIVVPDVRFKDVIEISKTSSIVSTQLDDAFGLLAGTLKGELVAYSEKGIQILSHSGNKPLQSIFSWKDFPYILFDDGEIKLYEKKTGKVTAVIQASLKDATLLNDHTVYLALNRGAAKLTLNKEVKLELIPGLNLRCYAIEVERQKNLLYISTADGLKIVHENGKTESISFRHSPVFANDICHFSDSIFIASKKQGVLIYKNGKFVKRILPEFNGRKNEIMKMEVMADRIYLLTTKGFMIINRTSGSSLPLNKVHGFSTNKIFDFEVSNECIWINHSRGIQKLDHQSMFSNPPKPGISLKEISVNDKTIPLNGHATSFGYNERNFRFVFSSPTLRNKENIRYHYKLDGYSPKWQVAGYFDNEVTFNALAPGNYTFTVKAGNRGVFSEPVSYSFSISAPIYLRWWFIFGVAVLVFAVISLVYRAKLLSQRKKAKQLNELNASKLTAIQSQMNPHFIFNSLNAIQDLVLKGDVDNSYTFITKFSDLVRRTLSYSEKDFIEFEQEIKLIELYLVLEQLRFKEELEYTIEKEGVEDIMIPPMLIQPFIENALLHGLLHKEGIKKLRITFRLKDLLICEITDNGIGRKASTEIKQRQRADHESFSGNAIKKRFEILSEHFMDKLGFEYEDLYEDGMATGTKVTLFIPVKHKF